MTGGDAGNMGLSVVIVSWNTRELLGQCLASIESYPPDCSYEVWVVDNASTDGSAAMVRERFPWARLIENGENVGFAAANNQAIRESSGRCVLLLNSDTEVQPGALAALVSFLDDRPLAAAVGPRLAYSDGGLQRSCYPLLTPEREFWRLGFLDRLWPRASYPLQRWQKGPPRRVDVIIGACLLLRRKALDEVGLLDERYFVYTEEVDLCYRLAEAGWELWYVPRITVVHHEAQSTRQVAAPMYLQLYRSKIQFFRKYGGARRVGRYKVLLRAAYWPRMLLATAASPLSSSLRARAKIYRELLAELPGI